MISTRRTAVALSVAALIASGLFGAAQAVAEHSARSTGARPSAAASGQLGHWTSLSGKADVEGGTPAVLLNAKHRATVLWLHEVSPNHYNYETATIGADGSAGPTTGVFGSTWGSLSDAPTLVAAAGKPLVVYDGIRGTSGPYSLGCVYGALGGTAAWTPQSWSLSADCANPIGPAAENSSGTIGAAWPAGNTVAYRIGTSSTIPASGSDSSIAIGAATASKIGMAADTAGANHFYLDWMRAANKTSANGLYAKDVTANGPVLKAPGSNVNTVNRLAVFADLPIAATNTHHGIYTAYCTGASKCDPKLWRIGATKAMSLPNTPNFFSMSISAGPAGRLWIAWYDDSTNKVYVTRTNEKDTRLGTVHSYSSPCAEYGLLGLSGGSWGRLDIAMNCVSNANATEHTYATQAQVGLHVATSDTKVKNTKKHSVTFTVTDVGDAVGGAKVSFVGQHATTNKSGKVSFTVAKHTKAGNYRAVASKSQYDSAHTTVRVVS